VHIILANPRGFCAGVNRAVETLNAALEKYGTPFYVYHEIVHNTWVVEDFRRRGVVFVNEINEVPAHSRLMFSAHGVSPEIRIEAAKRNIKTLDATCPLVQKVHRQVKSYASLNYRIILIGHRGHDEVNGVMNEAPDNIDIVENEAEIEALNYPEGTKLSYVTQTTLSVNETQKMTDWLRRKFPGIAGPPQANICYATQNRQDAVEKLCAGVDVALIVGSRTSSNSCRLAEKAEALGICAYLIDGHLDITSGLFRGDETVLISAGASAPEYVVQECLNVLKSRFNATVEEKTVCKENVRFRLPEELT